MQLKEPPFVPGTFPNSRVVGKDVTEFVENKPSQDYSPTADQPQPGTEVKLTRMRRAIGTNLQKSSLGTLHFNVTMSIDIRKTIKFRGKYNKVKEWQVSWYRQANIYCIKPWHVWYRRVYCYH